MDFFFLKGCIVCVANNELFFFLKGFECMHFFVTLSFGKVWTSLMIGASLRGMLLHIRSLNC